MLYWWELCRAASVTASSRRTRSLWYRGWWWSRLQYEYIKYTDCLEEVRSHNQVIPVIRWTCFFFGEAGGCEDDVQILIHRRKGMAYTAESVASVSWTRTFLVGLHTYWHISSQNCERCYRELTVDAVQISRIGLSLKRSTTTNGEASWTAGCCAESSNHR